MNIGIIGFGGMGHWHAESISAVEGLTLSGIYDINPDRSKKAASEGYRVYSSREELLADSEIGLVVIATPNNFHKDIAIAALSAGKNVICEKPVTMNSAELIEIIAHAKKCGKLFSVHQNRRWDTDYNIVKKALSENMVGKPFYIESRVQGSKGIPGDWRCEEVAGGGMLLDWGVHLIDQLMWMIDSPVTEIYTHMLCLKFSVDDNFKLLLKFKNGISALVEVDTCTFINLPRWHVSGDEGTLVVEDWECHGKIIKPNVQKINWEEGIVYTAAGATKTMAPRPVETLEEHPLPKVTTDCKDYYRNVVAAINGTAELIVKPEQALRVMQVIDLTFKSARTGTVIKCEI